MKAGDYDANCDVSVIIAAYNAERTVCAAVMSALCQGGVSVEVLVWDDASTDGTLEVLKTICDPRLKVFSGAGNVGPGRARDFLIERASGYYIAFLDADDIYCGGRLARLVRGGHNLPDSLVFDDIYECHDAAGGLVPFRRVHGDQAFRLGGAGGVGFFCVPLSALISSKRLLVKALVPRHLVTFLGVKHSDFRYGEDGLFLWTMLARGVRAYYLNVPGYLYRITPGSLSANPERFRELSRCFDALLSEGLSAKDRYVVCRRSREFIDRAALASVSKSQPIRKALAAVAYFAGDWSRFPNWLASAFLRLRYEVSRCWSGAPSRR